MKIKELYGELFMLMTHCACGDMDYISSTECAQKFQNMLDCLKKYANTEEELGIDLVTLFKALTEGAYFEEWNNPMYPEASVISFSKNVKFNLDDNGKRFWLDTPFTLKRHYLNEYGVTWALTKGELK